MEKIIVIGTGGHSAEIDDYFYFASNHNSEFTSKIIGFIDDNPFGYNNYKFSAPYLGTIKDHDIRTECSYIMGIANLTYRKAIIEKFVEGGANFTTFIHPTATISPSAEIGQGVVVALHANIGPNVKVGDFSLINSRSSIGHDAIIGKFNFISPNVCFSGFTSIGEENLFGINSATIPGITVGDRNKIMAGMTLDKSIGNDEIVFYRFKERIIAVSK